MLTFNDYIAQAQSNLHFLQKINEFEHPHWDWHCTVAFYSALHFINAHASKKAQRSFNSHGTLDQHINPYNQFAQAKLPSVIYDNYTEMMNMSRRSRYLSDGRGDESRIKVKHFMRQLALLDSIIIWFSGEYNVSINPIHISHSSPKKPTDTWQHFVIDN